MQHTINIYQRPAQGTAFVRRYPVTGYRHRISAMGGYDTASCQITAPGKYETDLFIERHLGAFVRVFADNPAMPCWEGIINRITTEDFTVGLDEMANRVKVQFSSPSAPTTNVTTAAANDTDSQAVYGIKEDVIDMVVMSNSATETRKENLRDATIAARAWPQKSVTDGQAGVISLEMVGIFHTLEWETYVYTTYTARTYNAFMVSVILPAIANGATFFDNSDTSQISAHTATRYQNENGNRSIWEIITKMAESGDGAIPWVVGITPTGFNSGTRVMYYRAINTAIEYTARLADGRRPRNLYGRLVSPWDVRPDRGIRITDVLLGWNGVGDNPMESWISHIEYDAETQAVKWYSADSTEVEAAFQLYRTSRATAKRFGAPARIGL